jgi:hypothetical protein
LGNADGDAGEAACAVQFHVELAFEGVIDRLDELPDGANQRLAGTRVRLR